MGLRVTLIDVGHGDCIFIESETASGTTEFALIDCPDTEKERPGLLYIKRQMQRRFPKTTPPRLKFVLMTHAHKDHCTGLHRIMKQFGTDWFFHGRATSIAPATHVFAFARRSSKVGGVMQIDATSALPRLTVGSAGVSVLYPDTSAPSANENNNSVVMALEEDGIVVVLTGDIETGCWSLITLPAGVEALKAPHHGASNGTFLASGASPWISALTNAIVGISCHTVPHGHPDAASVSAMASAGHTVFRTDEHGDITFCIDAGVLSVKCWQ